ncbi:hypothetical protein GJA_2327 [Janthinobacterium agaricidamnosum NBRC 102515 = DSM 9628]|uniref:Uncharacterized protein n=1 Tax=Janthinobacterium agaricidamnosum NBRC 102515 = DSM 9628 TaxID=1349767 RepID=W0V6T8_9BURK|nr:hypothetical protein GJA_2327 [Janthinobacterium agaricidamnosum NBRC 102515 = DSM 9628]
MCGTKHKLALKLIPCWRAWQNRQGKSMQYRHRRFFRCF